MNDPRERNALAVCLLGVFAVSVAPSALFLAPLPPSLASVQILGHVVSAILLIGCLGCLWGMFRRDHDNALLTEQGFVMVLAAGMLGYALAVIRNGYLNRVSGGWEWFAPSAYVTGLCVGITVFCVWRFVQIQRYVALRKHLRGTGAVGAVP